MRGRLPDCFPSEFVTVQNEQWVLLPGAPPEIVKEFNAYMEAIEQTKRKLKERFGIDDFDL